ncbi:hypothetical protein ACJX0J_011521, partial [Zea mays]
IGDIAYLHHELICTTEQGAGIVNTTDFYRCDTFLVHVGHATNNHTGTILSQPQALCYHKNNLQKG